MHDTTMGIKACGKICTLAFHALLKGICTYALLITTNFNAKTLPSF